jgi:hypothetical protein
MKFRKAGFLFALFFITHFSAHTQNLGVNRASIKWQQINTDASRIIFPVGQDSIANRVATLTEELALNHRGTIGEKLKKVDIVIQAENILSNGYVGLGPYRSELYLTPPQNPFSLGANNWADQLAIHEFRHAQQFSNFNVGLSKVGTILGGQYGRAVANNMAVPNWFWEGDAIWNETIHTQQGRGRVPLFFNEFKALDYGQKKYSWMKLRNGSLKDYVPDHYILGYLLVKNGREKYGDSVWSKVTKDAASFKGLFYPMQKAVNRNMGVTYTQFTNEALQSFSKQWADSYQRPDVWMTSAQHNNVVNYKYPYPMEDGGLVALKTSYREIPHFIRRSPTGEEYKIRVKDIGYNDYFSYNNGRIVYSAFQPDPRWANREYSVIRIVDLIDGSQKSLNTHTRYFSPDITRDGLKIVAVEVTPGKPAELHVINTNGDIGFAASIDSTLLYSHPKWMEDGQTVVVAARKFNGQMGWLMWGVEKNTFRWLLEPGERLVGFPVVQGDTLVYTHSANGVDGLQAIKISTGEVFELKNYAAGVYQGFLQHGRVVGSLFTADGYHLAVWENYTPVKASGVTDKMPVLYETKSPDNQQDFTDMATRQYTSTPYRKTIKLFNFHSWLPEPNEPDYTFTIVGENVLSTLNSDIFYNYNTNESSNRLGARLTFGDAYIMPFISGSQTWKREIQYNQDTTFTYNEGELAAGLILPLNLTGGKYRRRLNLTSSVNLENVKWTGLSKNLFTDQNFTALVNRVTYTSQIQQAVQHIYPRFAQTMIVDYRTLINNQTAKQFLASGAFYFPGLHVNHNLVVSAAYQARDTMRQYFFTNSFPFSRGYNDINYPRMFRLGVNYHFPLFYPDWGFGNMLYFQRVRANAFYDYTAGKSLRTGITTPFSTLGGEMFFDMKLWNVQPISFGFRYSYLLDTDLIEPSRAGLFEFVLPINLFSR